MSTQVLGTKSFSNVPTVSGNPLMVNAGGAPSVQSGLLSSLPAAGTLGRLFITTDTNNIYRDDGTSWVMLSGSTSPTVYQALTSTVPATSGTTVITLNNNVPTITTGTQVWSQTITPTASTSRMHIAGTYVVSSNPAARTLTMALFRGSVCIGVSGQYLPVISVPYMMAFNFVDAHNSTTDLTYTMRVGISAASTWYVGRSSTAYFGGMYANNAITVTELA